MAAPLTTKTHTAPNAPGSSRLRETDFAMVPNGLATRSQRKAGGGFTISPRAIALYCRIRKHCHSQRGKRGGMSCEVAVGTLGAASGVHNRQVRNLRRQLVEQGIITVELERGVHGTNVYHLVLPLPPAVEELLPGKPARTTGPFLAVTPGNDVPVTPRQDFAAALDVRGLAAVGGRDFLDPTPERQKGAGASGPALSGADTPPAPPVPPPSGRAGKANPDAAGGVTTGKPKAGSLERSAKSVPLQEARNVVIKPRDTGPVVEIWPKQWDGQREILERFLRVEFPSIPLDVVTKVLDATRAAKLDEITGGTKVRSAWRYASKVARRILAARPQGGRVSSEKAKLPQGVPSAESQEIFSRLPATEQNASGLSQGEPNPSVTTEAREKMRCGHGFAPDENCKVCDDEGAKGEALAARWNRGAQRHALRKIEIANKTRSVPSEQHVSNRDAT